jgi:hypothetical protein
MSEANMTTMAQSGWGPLKEPVHGSVPEGRPPWKDNAFLTFWDPAKAVVGTVHVSTSPNAEGRRARFSLSIDGRIHEVVETLAAGSFRSASISFGLDEDTTVSSPRLACQLSSTPLFALADYTAGSVIPPLVPDEPLHHYQRAARVTGKLVLDGHPVEIDGLGFRDRTWGYRDESANISEYLALMVTFPTHAYSVIRLRGTTGVDLTEGYRLTEDGGEPIGGVSVTRDASSLLAHARLTCGDNRDIVIHNRSRHGGFWLPMGWERHGPTLGAYDEFFEVEDDDGRLGFGMAEHGIVRLLY